MLGISELIDTLNKYKSKKIKNNLFDYSIGLFGKTNVGKSTLLNKLVGFERSTVSNKPKTTTDIVLSSFNFKNYNFLIKDTAGLIKKSKIDKDSLDYYATKKTLSIIHDLDLNIFLIDIDQGFDNQSKKIFNIVYKKSNTILFVINKIDLIKKNKNRNLIELKQNIQNQFSQSKNIHFIAISSFNSSDINKLKKSIYKLTNEIQIKLSTSKINQWLKFIKDRNPHPRIKGNEVKFKYATQVSDKPLKIKIFSNYSTEISMQYKRFLLNSFYEYFKIKSKNINIIFSKSQNPFN